MKSVSLIITALAITLISCAQDIPASKVPSVVQNTLQSTFSNAAKIEWEKKGNLYEAEFEIDKTEYTAHIEASGKLLVYKVNITTTELPAAITQAIARDHASYRLDDADKLVKDGTTYYQVELEAKGKKDVKVVYAANGQAASINYMH